MFIVIIIRLIIGLGLVTTWILVAFQYKKEPWKEINPVIKGIVLLGGLFLVAAYTATTISNIIEYVIYY